MWSNSGHFRMTSQCFVLTDDLRQVFSKTDMACDRLSLCVSFRTPEQNMIQTSNMFQLIEYISLEKILKARVLVPLIR